MGSSLFRTLRRVLVDVIIPCRGEAGLAQCVWHLGYGLGIPRNRVRFHVSPIHFYFLSIKQTDVEVLPAFCSNNGEGCPPGVRRLGCGADHLLPFGAEVKDARSYTSTPTYTFMAYRLIK